MQKDVYKRQRKQKAREGKWNGGFAPYGYELVNGELQIAEDEAEIIRLTYDKFIHTNMGISAIAAWPVSYTHLDVYKRQTMI